MNTFTDTMQNVPGVDSGEVPPATKVQKAKPALQGSAVNLPEVELWPEVVNGADTLSQIAETFTRYVALPAGAARTSRSSAER